ncbi:MAG: 3-carboxy-cis,cis-muconate cycloisomerase, partial [Acetobacteraceae bacterium]|nr:3-carboxy-cis,cis-muconate cycloisomerase [Acetobacteraceae bacterium]
MAATAPESLIFGDLFGTPAMRTVFGDAALAGRWAEAEAALATAEAECGLIPSAAARAIAAAARRFTPDLRALGEKTVLVGYPIVELVRQLGEGLPAEARGFVHWGATTQDIMDTAVILQLRDALALVEADIEAIRAELARLARAHRDT